MCLWEPGVRECAKLHVSVRVQGVVECVYLSVCVCRVYVFVQGVCVQAWACAHVGALRRVCDSDCSDVSLRTGKAFRLNSYHLCEVLGSSKIWFWKKSFLKITHFYNSNILFQFSAYKWFAFLIFFGAEPKSSLRLWVCWWERRHLSGRLNRVHSIPGVRLQFLHSGA